MDEVGPDRALSRRFLVAALILGLAYLVINPPFAVNDEDVHLYRVFELASGQLITHADAKGEYHYVPADYAELGPRYQTVHHRSKTRVRVRNVLRKLATRAPQAPLVRVKSRAGGYHPLAYHFQIPAVWLASKLSLSAFWHVILARLASLFVYIALAWWAVSSAGSTQWLFVSLALTPMTLTQAAGVSSDGLLLGLGLVYFALIAKGGVTGKEVLTRKEFATLIMCGVGMVLIKPPYLILGLAGLVLRVDTGRRQGLLRALGALAAVAVALGVYSLWNRILESGPQDPSRSVSRQLLLIFSDPPHTWKVVVATMLRYTDDVWIQTLFLRHMISNGARFAGGTGSTLLGLTLFGLSWGMARGRVEPPSPRRQVKSAWLAAVFVAQCLAIPTALYLCCTAVSGPFVRGVQGRYFSVALPALGLALSLVGRPVVSRWLRLREGRVLWAAILLANLFCLFTLIGWHYYPASAEWPL